MSARSFEVEAGGRDKRISLEARFTAAQSIGKSRLYPIMAYRAGEYCANVLCLFGYSWILDWPGFLVISFLLWYLPAAIRTQSPIKPLRFPLLLFVVDDFSLLGLHPTPRPAYNMYLISLFRFLTLTVVIPLIGHLSFLPAWLQKLLEHDSVMDILRGGAGIHGREIPTFALGIWAAGSIIVLALAVLWALATIALLVLAVVRYGGRPFSGAQNKDWLARFDMLAEQIEACQGSACREELIKLQKNYPVHVTSFMSTYVTAAGILSHLFFDLTVAHTFFAQAARHKEDVSGLHHNRNYVLGCITVVNLVLTMMNNARLSSGNPFGVISEAKESLRQGMYTKTFVKILYGDLGAHSFPTLAVKIYGLPFAAESIFAVAGGVFSILSSINTAVPFIVQQFDMGVERTGYKKGHLGANGLFSRFFSRYVFCLRSRSTIHGRSPNT